MDELARFLDLEQRLLERVSTRVEPFELGVAYFDDDCPERYYSNLLRVGAVPDGVTADDLAGAADTILGGAGLAHRLVLVNDERGAARVALGVAALGYGTSWNVVMRHARDPDRGPTVAVERVPFARARSLIRESYVRDPDIPDRLADPFTEQHGLMERAFGATFFVGVVDGEPVGSCELYVDGADAQVENVATLEEFRGRGVASSVVLAAVEAARAAGAAHVFIVAEDDDWPKDLYARLGFDRVGRIAGFLRTPAAAG